MKHASVQAKSTRQSTIASLARPSAEPHGSAFAPPIYGIDFVDQQQPLGSHAVPIQEKLIVTSPSDQYEQEANRVARQVVDQINTPPTVQHHGKQEDSEAISLLPQLEVTAMHPQGAAHSVVVPAALTPAVQQARHGGQAIPEKTREPLERGFAADFRKVRIHADSRAAQLSRALQARAFTTGHDIFFGPGAYNPSSRGGQELLAHELTHVLQQSQGTILGTAHHVQRSFGFEIELPILLTGYTETDNYFDPAVKNEGTIVTSPNFDIKVDHQRTDFTQFQLNAVEDAFFARTPQGAKQKFSNFREGPSIIELVTKPWDESVLTEAQVGTKMQFLVDLVTDLRANTENFTKMARLIGHYYVGAPLPDGSPAPEIYGNVQATYGVQLSRIPELFTWQSQALQPQDVTSTVLQSAVAAAHRVTATLQSNHNLSNADLPQLRGFLTLLCNYLIAGRTNIPGNALGKNRLGQLFYKTSMANLRNELGTNAGAGKYLDKRGGTIRTYLLTESGRTAMEPLLASSPDWHTCGEWLDGVITGSEDVVFKKMKNPDSSELGPDQLGPSGSKEVGPVIENRRLNLQIAPDKPPQNYAPEKWVALAKTIYHKMKEINQIP